MINRDTDYEIMREIRERWSPRAFDPEKEVAEDDLMALFEAARFAPSCFNEQPWRYLVAKSDADREKVASILTPANAEWASHAPVLLLILSKRQLERSGKDNKWHMFDAGTSWGYFSLEAQRRGLITHAMGGFDAQKVREVFGITEDYSVIAAVAVGYYGKIEQLSERNRDREHPSPRKPAKELLFVGQSRLIE